METAASSNELQEVKTTLPQSSDAEAPNELETTQTPIKVDEVLVHTDKNRNANANNSKVTVEESTRGGKDNEEKKDVAPAQQQQPYHYRITRRSHEHPHQFQNQQNYQHQHPSNSGRSHVSFENTVPQIVLSPSDEERFRICVVLVTAWIFLLIAILFLVCYGYQLEWSPETADPIHVFSLELAVNLVYLMFIVDIFASIGIILSYKDHVKPFRLRVFWPAIAFLVLNQIHGTFIWLWVWTGEFPRTCARNSFYLGRRCENIDMLMVLNPEGKLRLGDCKCDYGTCLPECRGLRLIQNYFWGTYWLYICRIGALIIFIPRLNEIVCQ